MALVVVYDIVTKQVKEIIKSADTPSYDKRSDVLINPEIKGVLELKYLKADTDNNSVVDMDSAEQTAVNQAQVSKDTAEKQQLADNLEYPLVDVVTALIKRINVRIPANPITKQEIINQLKVDKGL